MSKQELIQLLQDHGFELTLTDKLLMEELEETPEGFVHFGIAPIRY